MEADFRRANLFLDGGLELRDSKSEKVDFFWILRISSLSQKIESMSMIDLP